MLNERPTELGSLANTACSLTHAILYLMGAL